MPLLNGLTAVFEPRRIALVGASDRPGRTGELFWRNLSNFPGEVVPVTRSAETVAGHKAYPSLLAVEGDVDLVVVVVPAAAVPAVIREAGVKGVSAAIVISGGFAEAGPDGLRRHYELMAAVHASGVRIVGPNCFGVQNCDLPLNASMASGTPRGGGGISLVTQSGAYGMAIHSLGIDERVRFAKIYAAGNKADISDAELLSYLGNDSASRTLCFFLESLPDGRAFFEVARRVTPHKPVIVAKTGRSVAGVRAAWSHTAGLAGSERIWRAAFEQAGVILARSGLEMLDVARALDTQPPPSGRRVAIITNSGGTGVELADLLSDERLGVPELSAELQNQLRSLLPPLASPRNPVDLTPVWSRFAELYPLVVDLLARSGEVDAVVPVLLQRSAADEQVAMGLRTAVAQLRADGVMVPVYVCWVAPWTSRPNADLLQEAGIPCFDWPERTARAMGHAIRYGESRIRARPPVADPVERPAAAPLSPGRLDTSTAAAVLETAGIHTAAGRLCASAEEATTAAGDLGYPVVVKADHPDLVHKTESGGVRLGLHDGAAVQAAATDLLTLAPGAAILVQRQYAGTEVLVGGLRDPQFGPVVLAGLGGVFVQVLDDIAVGLAPLGLAEARDLLARLRAYPVLTGARGAVPIDLDALADVLRSVGDLLVAHREIAELDLNPVLADADGYVAVDWRILVENPPGQDQERPQDSPRHAGETRAGQS
jgi:acyl-CoA synthetase (NDP forming)